MSEIELSGLRGAPSICHLSTLAHGLMLGYDGDARGFPI